ncbi:hypothetical protein BJ165DRAFT_1410984 [Panaeolus papilionaceus]|nr:hypothetical protein BJ165DRAFT_1410984 [Panaeolus papilionaceus]
MSSELGIPTDSYKELVINGPITVELVTDLPTTRNVFIFMLLGPTGSGKSTFIESLAPKGSLDISSHQLEGFTRSISLYQIKNMFSSPSIPIYLVDVPGFGDTKISEMRIVNMIKEWKEQTGARDLGRIFYLTPINCVRLPGSQRRMLKTFQSLTGIDSAKNVVFVSTMWDILWGESSTRRACSNFKQLEEDILQYFTHAVDQDYIKGGSKLFKFENTLNSALTILDHASRGMDPNLFHIEATLESAQDLREAAFGANLYENLQSRVDTLRVQITTVQVELKEAIIRGDTQLSSVVAPQLEEAEKLLATFEQELQTFGLPLDRTTTQALSLSPNIQQDLVSPDVSLDSPVVVASPGSSSFLRTGRPKSLPHTVGSGDVSLSTSNRFTGFDRTDNGAGLKMPSMRQGAFTRALNLIICCGQGKTPCKAGICRARPCITVQGHSKTVQSRAEPEEPFKAVQSHEIRCVTQYCPMTTTALSNPEDSASSITNGDRLRPKEAHRPRFNLRIVTWIGFVTKGTKTSDVRATSSSAGYYTLDDRREVNVAEGALRLRIGVSVVD